SDCQRGGSSDPDSQPRQNALRGRCESYRSHDGNARTAWKHIARLGVNERVEKQKGNPRSRALFFMKSVVMTSVTEIRLRRLGSGGPSRVAAILMRDSRNHGAKFSTLGSFQFRDALDLDVHGSEATFGYPLTDHCFFFLSKSLGSDDPDSDQIPALLNDLSFHH